VYHVLIGQNEMFLMEIGFEFHVLIIYKEKMKKKHTSKCKANRCTKACSSENWLQFSLF